MRIRNPDGSEAEACGNATRCIAWLLQPRDRRSARVASKPWPGCSTPKSCADGLIAVDMGPARTGWREIPLARAADTDRVDLALGPLSAPVCTNIGNPHATFFVDDADGDRSGGARPRARARPAVPAARQYRRRRGSRPKPSEAARLGARRRDHPGLRQRRLRRRSSPPIAAVSPARHAAVELDGGTLDIAWREDGHVIMTGPAALSFEGAFDAALLAGR